MAATKERKRHWLKAFVSIAVTLVAMPLTHILARALKDGTAGVEDEQFYICHDGRELRHLRTESKEQDGYTQIFEVYGCADCSGCQHKARCLYKYDVEKDAEKNKVMKINEQWEELKERSHANIQSERGILKRQTRSIQTEGHFGDIKENENFRRFNDRSADKVYKEFMLYAIGRNINKYHRFLYEKLRKFEGKTA